MHCSFCLTGICFRLAQYTPHLSSLESRGVDVLPGLVRTKVVHMLCVSLLCVHILLHAVERCICFGGVA